MNLLLDPNVAYLLLVVGVWVAVLALFTPGTGYLEVGALFMLALAGYGIYNLEINLWALVVLILGVFPLLLTMRKTRHWVFLALSIVALIVGSMFIFRSEDGLIAIHPALASVVSVASVGLMWLIGRRSLEALLAVPSHDLNALIGLEGEARSEIHMEGTVYVHGEEWTAQSSKPIPAGSRVVVVGRSGLVLRVEPVLE
ncbi:MAG: hypothetical protein HPY76_06600 [Anaerolineae bacterium]|nr:hypothetical protein [Anaerolineae bacterium]